MSCALGRKTPWISPRRDFPQEAASRATRGRQGRPVCTESSRASSRLARGSPQLIPGQVLAGLGASIPLLRFPAFSRDIWKQVNRMKDSGEGVEPCPIQGARAVPPSLRGWCRPAGAVLCWQPPFWPPLPPARVSSPGMDPGCFRAPRRRGCRGAGSFLPPQRMPLNPFPHGERSQGRSACLGSAEGHLWSC